MHQFIGMFLVALSMVTVASAQNSATLADRMAALRQGWLTASDEATEEAPPMPQAEKMAVATDSESRLPRIDPRDLLPKQWFGVAEVSDDKGSARARLYLLDRGITQETLDLYSPRIKQTNKGNFMFGHYGPNGFSGFEIKSEEKGRFASGCEKAMFSCLVDQAKVKRLAITETAIDALSYAQKDGCREDTAYISMAGNPSPEQLEQLKALASMDKIQEVVMAHDNDEGGHKQVAKCQEALAGVDVKISKDLPDAGQDWNQMVKCMQEQSQDRGLER